MNATRAGSALAAGLMALALAGCNDPAVGTEPVGELVAMAGESDGAWIHDIRSPILLQTQRDLDHWLQAVPPGALDELRDVDLRGHSVVIGTYGRCTETSAVYVDRVEGGRSILRFAVEREENADVCDHSPMVLDAWLMPWSDTGGHPPLAVSSSDAPEGPTVPRAVGSIADVLSEADLPAEDITALLDAHHDVIRTEQQRDALVTDLTRVMEEGDGERLRIVEIDMDEHVLLLVAYNKCTEESHIYADPERHPTLLWLEISREEDVQCVWSPLTVDIWQVPIAEISDRFELGQYTLNRAG